MSCLTQFFKTNVTYQNHQTVFFKWVNCIVYELYLNKTVLKKVINRDLTTLCYTQQWNFI